MTTNRALPEDSIEAVARWLWNWDDSRSDNDLPQWYEAVTDNDWSRTVDAYRAMAQQVLEAAAPYIRSQALLDAAHAAIDPTSEDMDKYFIDQSDAGLWLRARAALERAAL